MIRYVEQNPVRAGITKQAATYAWSSAQAHLGLEESALLDSDWWNERWSVEAWAAVLEEGDEEAAAIRLATYSGRPYGGADFVRGLEQELGRTLERRKGGRPRKEPVDPAQMELWATGE